MFHDAEIVGDEEVGQAKVALQLQQQVENLRLHRDIQRGDGLVTDDELGLQSQCAGDADALALAAAEFKRVAECRIGWQAHALEQLGGPLATLGAGAHLLNDKRLLQNLADGVPWIERLRRVLEDHLHLAAHGAQRALGERGDVCAVKIHAAGGRLEQAHDGARHGRFAAAAFAHETERFARLQCKAHAVHRLAHRLRGVKDAAAYREVHLEVLYG